MQRWTECIGHTPLVALPRLSEEAGAELCAKMESQNPGGSAKDRAALYMIEDAVARGALKPGGTIIEPTSGNTGVGLAAIGAALGFDVILTMPDTMSVERRKLLAAYGAQIVLTDGRRAMAGAIEKAHELLRTIDGAWMPDQFGNPANARAHEETTGPEIWEQTGGRVDMVVMGVGTGGTLTGVARALKKRDANVRIIAVEPETSAVLSGKPAGPHPLMGLGAGFVPDVLDVALMDEILPVGGAEAKQAARVLAQKEGILTGFSGGAVVHAAFVLAARAENKGKRIVIVLPDTGERYLSTYLFEA